MLSFFFFAMMACDSNLKSSSVERRADEVAIRNIVEEWEQAWDDLDADKATRAYADDVDWVNAFGGKRKGRKEIRAFLAKRFQTGEHQSGKTTISNLRIRFVRPDVAIVMNEFTRTGQKCPNGEPMRERNGTQQRVLEKRNGVWKIVSHLIQDRTGHDLPGVCGSWTKVITDPTAVE